MPEDRWSELCQRWGELGYEALSRSEKTWLNIRSLIDSVENGGVISYFCNSGAATVTDCLADLSDLGAADVCIQLQRVCALFSGGVPVDLKARNDAIDSWSEGEAGEAIDQLLEEVDEALMPQMADLESRLSGHLERSGLAR